MNKFLLLGTVVFSILAFGAYKVSAQENTAGAPADTEGKKILIAY